MPTGPAHFMTPSGRGSISEHCRCAICEDRAENGGRLSVAGFLFT